MRGLPEQFGRNWYQAQGTWNILKRVLKSLFTDLVPRESLPTTDLVVGRFIIFKAATRVYWFLVYTGEETYPWAKLGGPPLVAQTNTAPARNNAAYGVLAVDPLSITIPLAGDYDIRIEGQIWNENAPNRTGYLSYAFEGMGGASDAWSAASFAATASSQAPSKMQRHFGVNKGTVIAEQARTGEGSMVFSSRRLIVDPVRVG